MTPGKILRHPVAIGLFSLLLVTGGGWVGDAGKGDCLNFFGLRACPTKAAMDWPGFAAALVLFALGAIGIYFSTRNYLRVRELKLQKDIRGAKAIILAVSTLSRGIAMGSKASAITKDGISVELTGDIDKDIDALEPLNCNTQQFLRALAPHVATVERIVLVGSPGEKGSARLRPAYAELVHRYLPTASIDCQSDEVDMEDLDAMRILIDDLCEALIQDHGVAEDNIMIDVTGGQKTASIAAAIATLHRPRVRFQYVSTTLPFAVKAFNVVGQTPYRLS